MKNANRRSAVGSKAIATLACCALAVGCGDGKPRRVPVTGTIRYQNKPLEGGDVVFVPVDARNGFRAIGKTDDQGQFALTTFQRGDGAVPGEYKVTVFAYHNGDPSRDTDMIAPPVGAPAVPEKYSSQRTTDLAATVGNEPTVVEFELKDH
jgi:hypothetical protein